MKPLLIIGAASFGRLVGVLAHECGRPVAGFIDDATEGPDILGGTCDLGVTLLPSAYELVMAVGYRHMQARFALYMRLRDTGFHFPALVHPSARVSPHANVGDGSLVMAGADVDAFSVIGEACVLWPRSVVSHDNHIGSNTFISPAATLCGFVNIGQSSFVGANSTVVDGSTLAEGSFVKAASRYHSKTQAT